MINTENIRINIILLLNNILERFREYELKLLAASGEEPERNGAQRS